MTMFIFFQQPHNTFKALYMINYLESKKGKKEDIVYLHTDKNKYFIS